MSARKFQPLLRPDVEWGRKLVAEIKEALPGATCATYGSQSGAVTLDLAASDCATLTLAGNVTLTLRPAADGTAAWLKLTQDATGGRTVALSGGVVPGWTMTATANQSDLLGFVYVGGEWVGTSWATGF